MTFTGTLVTDLQALVDRHLNRSISAECVGGTNKEHPVAGAHSPNSTTLPGCNPDRDIFGVPGA